MASCPAPSLYWGCPSTNQYHQSHSSVFIEKKESVQTQFWGGTASPLK